MSEERPALPAAARVTSLTSEQLLIRDRRASVPIHVEEAITRVFIDSNANSSGTDSHLSAPLDPLVLKTFDNLLRTPATLKMITDAMLDIPGFIAPVATLVKSEHSRLTTKHNKIDVQCRQFMALGANSGRAMAAQMSEQVEEPPADVSDDAETNLWV